MTSSNNNLDELDWIQLRKDMDEVALSPETFIEKAKRKFSAEPLIPIGNSRLKIFYSKNFEERNK